jgi:polysaccharide deacetylase family protein (PEP-CTERM system associated)
MSFRKYRHILLTIDVEDWFQVENFKPWIPFNSWDRYDLRVEANTYRLLDFFDSIDLAGTGGAAKPKATFFVLGWLAERLPHLVRAISDRGHEVASHGYNHNLCSSEKRESLLNDLKKSKQLLEDITGKEVLGYRAPSFSISNDTLKLIESCGYTYDASYNSFSLNTRYGRLYLHAKRMGIAYQLSSRFFELPLSNLMIGKRSLPFAGGGYFRVIPWPLFRVGVKMILKKDGAYAFYMHPWEIDREQPRVHAASMLFRIRHYINLGGTWSKLTKLTESFAGCTYTTCAAYLSELFALDGKPGIKETLVT